VLSVSQKIEKIGVLGGGVAGYLTALALRNYFPFLKVTLIESDRIPIIGVGEATTPPLVDFLHNELGFDLGEFYREVQPTHKMGIRFDWGLPAPYYFNYPFEPQDIYLAHTLARDVTQSSLQSVFMNGSHSFIVGQEGESKAIQSIAKKGNYAYHLDNKMFVSYLKKKAFERGVVQLSDTVKHVQRNSTADQIEHLDLESGRSVSFDFYVDCSGFSSMLLEKSLGVKFVDYSSSLFTDSALTGSIPVGVKLPSYTGAVTMNHGWKWKIPLRESIHIGYVYSSDFADARQVESELRNTHPEIQQTRHLNFRSGRHENALHGNVLAMGNAFGFVEPLESTGLHMIVSSLKAFGQIFNNLEFSGTNCHQYNKIINDKWDQLRWFLSLHYKFNKRLDTPFWKSNRRHVDVSGYQDLIKLMQEEGPLRQETHMNNLSIRKKIENSIIKFSGLDTFLVGQGILPDQINTNFVEQERKSFLVKLSLWNQLAFRAVSHREALDIIEQNPDILE
jgi:tryptophan halogenase